MKHTANLLLKYKAKPGHMIFWCSSAVDESDAVSAAFEKFLLEASRGKQVFVHTYRLPAADEGALFDLGAVVARAGVPGNPFETFLHLDGAKLRASQFHRAVEATVYFFDSGVSWNDFLAAPVMRQPAEWIQKGLLSAHFSSCDHGADFWFEGAGVYEKPAFSLFERLSRLGYGVSEAKEIFYPDTIK